MGGDGTIFAEAVDFFVSFAFDVNLIEFDFEELGNVVADGIFVGTEFGFLEDDGDVDVVDVVLGGVHFFDGLDEENTGVGAFPLWVVIGEELADIGEGECTKDGIGDGVVDDIAIGMADAAAVVIEGDTADDEVCTFFKSVEVEAVANAERECHFKPYSLSLR